MPASRGRGLGLKFLQWFIRALQFAGAVIILGIYIYFLISLHDHKLAIPTSVRAVTGIAGSAVLYTGIGLLLLCCLAGLPATSLIAMIIDVAYLAAFIYVAVANKGGASQCKGEVNTIYGSGKDGDEVEGGSGKITKLPSLRTACKLETACLAIAIIQVFLFLFSTLTEFGLGRNRQREKRIARKEQSQAQYGQIHDGTEAPSAFSEKKSSKGGFLGRLLGRKRGAAVPQNDPNALPQHSEPGRYNRASDGTQDTVVAGGGAGEPSNKYETGYGYTGHPMQQHDGVVGDSYEHADDPYRQRYSFENPYENRHQGSTPYDNPYENPYVERPESERPPQQAFHQAFHQQRRPVPTQQNYDDGIYDRV